MLPGYSGTLLSEAFLEIHSAGTATAHAIDALRREMSAWRRRTNVLGPASGLRAMLELGAAPLVQLFEFEAPAEVRPVQGTLAATLRHVSGVVGLIVAPWGDRLDPLWRLSVTEAIGRGAPYALVFNGTHLRLVDARRLFARRVADFDLALTAEDGSTLSALWSVARGQVAAATGVGSLDALISASNEHATSVCRALRDGVRCASTEILRALVARRVRLGSRQLGDAFEQALILVYRMLFLLFAEARGVVPVWHPVYRESYSFDALGRALERTSGEVGVWDALRAIARLAHTGCRAGDLAVTPFNGRLFAPSKTPLAERRDLDDRAAQRAILALMTRARSGGVGRERIAYRDLGVEQLGAVYETLLDYEPRTTSGTAIGEKRRVSAVEVVKGSSARKATGSFYTPQPIAEYLVRQTLGPLVKDCAADRILQLRVVDPAMGSGAFLVAACRYLAASYEDALVREGRRRPDDFDERARATIRRTIAERCLYGVDLNPMAVQLARLSLWLTTLAADRPLNVLDHRLHVGDSLAGAWVANLGRLPGVKRAAHRHNAGQLPLFDAASLGTALADVIPSRFTLESTPDDTLDQVRTKEQLLVAIRRNVHLSKWKRIADLWCAIWLGAGAADVPSQAYGALSEAILAGRTALPARTAAEYLRRAQDMSRDRRFFHWELEFPEVFWAPDGTRRPDAGFDAVIGNPPWDMVRADAGPAPERDRLRMDVRSFVRFVRDAGVYDANRDGHPNRFQLFAERAVRLARRRGRVGLVLPSGVATDCGCSELRRRLLTECAVDALVGIDNRTRVFPIHRSVRFVLLTATTGIASESIQCRFGLNQPSEVESLASEDMTSAAMPSPVSLSLALLRRLSGPSLTIPLFTSRVDVQIAERACALFPPLGSDVGWNARFGRELNATDDSDAFVAAPRGLPIVEGKQLAPFRVDLTASRHGILGRDARRLLADGRYTRPRLAYRDVAGATNRITLIAAILPRGCISTHTIFCLRTRLDAADQHVLCGLFNSFVVNYFVRLRVTTHVTTALVEQLPIARPPRTARAYREIAAVARLLARRPHPVASARLQGLVAQLYQLNVSEFEHVLSTFPLVSTEERNAALEAFHRDENWT